MNVAKVKTVLLKVELSATCLLLEDWFIFVAAALRFLFPSCRILQASAKLWTLTHFRSGTTRSRIKQSDARSFSRSASRSQVGWPPTFDVGVPGAVVADPQRGPFLGLGAERRLQQVVHQLIVDLKEGHPQCEEAAACFCWVTAEIWREDRVPGSRSRTFNGWSLYNIDRLLTSIKIKPNRDY